MTTVILVPVLGRPHRVAPLLRSIADGTPEAHRVVFVVDAADAPTRVALAANQAEWIVCGGSYAKKINVAVRATTEPLIFLGADDLHFHDGWLTAARRYITEGAHVVGVNDLCSKRVQAGVHATHFLLTREYAERPAIDGEQGPLSEAYTHSFVDDELVATARHRGTLAFASEAVVEHLHPDAGKADWDDTYARGREYMRVDRRIFRKRAALWT